MHLAIIYATMAITQLQFEAWWQGSAVWWMMARSESRQVPLGTVDMAELPDEVRALVPLAAEGVDLSMAAERRGDVLEWLMTTYAK